MMGVLNEKRCKKKQNEDAGVQRSKSHKRRRSKSVKK